SRLQLSRDCGSRSWPPVDKLVVQNGLGIGVGLAADCVRPIVQGTGQRLKASTLPQVDQQTVAASKARNPNWKVNPQRAGKTEQTAPRNPHNAVPNERGPTSPELVLQHYWVPILTPTRQHTSDGLTIKRRRAVHPILPYALITTAAQSLLLSFR